MIPTTLEDVWNPQVTYHWIAPARGKSCDGDVEYLHALLESEARHAAAAAGLDPGIGFMHVDTDARDRLACDLMETCRPHVDAFLLDWIISLRIDG